MRTLPRRLLRRIGFGLVALIGFVVLVGVLFGTVAPLRNRVLIVGLDRVAGALPGELTVEHPGWPSLARLDLQGVLWVDEGDTLLVADRLLLDARIRPLWERDLVVRSIEVLGLQVNVPAMVERFPAGEPDPGKGGETAAGEVPFLRGGYLPGIPSIEVETVRVTAPRVILPDSSTVRDVAVELSAELLADSSPRVSIQELSGYSPEQGWRVTSGTLEAALASGRVRGDIVLALQGQPLYVRMRSPEQPEQRVLITVGPDSVLSVPETWGVEVQVDLTRREEVPVSGAYQLTVVTPSTRELEQLPLSDGSMAGLPDLERLRVDAEGGVTWDPAMTADAELHIRPNAWMEPGFVRATWSDGALVCDTLDVGMPDLRVTGTVGMVSDSLDARARVRVRGTRWLGILQPEATPPDSLVADLRAFMSGPLKAPRATARLEGGVRSGSVTVAPLELDVSWSPERTGSFILRARSFDLWAGLDGTVSLADREPLVADLSPLRIVDALRTAEVGSGGERGRVTFDVASRDLEVESFRMTGELGELRVAASFADLVEGTASVDWTLQHTPALLLRLLHDRPQEREALAAAWEAEEPVHLKLNVTGTRRGEGMEAAAEGDFLLPGPRRLRALLPEGADVDVLGPLAGSLRLSFAQSTEGSSFSTDVDLSRTEWIDAARLVAHGTPERVTVDSLALGLEGMRARVSGTIGEDLDLTAFARVDSLSLPRRILGMEEDELEAFLEVEARVEGPRTAPAGRMVLDGSGTFGDNRVSVLHAEARLDHGRLNASVDAGAELAAGQLIIDSARLRVASTADSLFPARIDLDVEGPDLGLHQNVEVYRDRGWLAVFDTLSVRLRTADFRNQSPFTIAVDAAAESLHVDGLNLSGSLGRILVNGGAGPHGADLVAEVDVDLPDTPPKVVSLPAGLEGVWPDSITFNVRAEGIANVRSNLLVTGIDYAGKENMRIAMELRGGADGVQGDLGFGNAEEQLAKGRVEVPGSISVYPPSFSVATGSIEGALSLTNLPVPLSPQDPDLFAMGNGELAIGGSAETPSVGLELRLTFPQWKKLAGHRLDLDVDYGGSGPDSMLGVNLALVRDGTSILTGEAEVPLRLGLLPTLVEASAERPMNARITSQWISLADFDELLPSDLSLSGRLKLDLTAEGAREALGFDGAIQLRDVETKFAGSSRAVIAGQLDLGGTLDRPSVHGDLELKNGVIRIPQQKRTLHPVAGTAELWEQTVWAANPDSAVMLDTLFVAKSKPLDMDLDVRLVIPGGLWIRGRDMELELEGDLKVVQKGQQPAVTGKLKARRGDLRFVGRQFKIDRGDVFFYGGDEINPSLDLRLKSEIDKMTFWVAITGTALEPKLKLTSEPEALSEGDIMCYLVFGQRCDELDSGQGDLVGRMAAGYASAELTQALSSELGVDMVSINVGDSQSATSVTVGKYLSNKLLLKYEQAIDSTREFLVNLEYSLTRTIKLTTLAGSRQSGAEIRWSVEY